MGAQHAPGPVQRCSSLPGHQRCGGFFRLRVAPLLVLVGTGLGLPPGSLALPPPPDALAAPRPPGPDCARAVEALRAQRARLEANADRLAVVLLGEIHTSAADHAWQLATLEVLAQQGRPLTPGLDMVPAAHQPLLTRFASGQLTEADFLTAVDWPAIWGHDPELYGPLLRWARRQGVPLLALNLEPEVVRRVRRLGLEALPPAEREGIGAPAPAGAAYRERLRAAWLAHQSMADPSSPAAVPLRLSILRQGRPRELELRLAPPAAGSPGRMEPDPPRNGPAAP